jgi:uncharacterized protein DUF3426
MPRRIDLGAPSTDSAARAPFAPGTNLPALAQPRPRRAPALGWVLLIVILGLIGSGAVFGKSAIITRWPEAERIYRLVGLDPKPAPGLDVRAVRFERKENGGKAEIVVEGTLANTAPDSIVVPALRASLRDGSGHEVASWSFNIDRPELLPDETVDFKTTFADPPGAVASASVALGEGLELQ